mmetsp:Transcript_99360/g.290006  ORF Transcript_99360/g.290006 Transcript_99360/m.290006 type:complete len:282 (+) Transcript_99360:210-1055(+)
MSFMSFQTTWSPAVVWLPTSARMARTPRKSPLKPCLGRTTRCTVRACITRASPLGSSRYPSWNAGSLKLLRRSHRSFVMITGVVLMTLIGPRCGEVDDGERLLKTSSRRRKEARASCRQLLCSAESIAEASTLCSPRKVTCISRLAFATACAAFCELSLWASWLEEWRRSGVRPLARVTASHQAQARSHMPVTGFVNVEKMLWKCLAALAGKLQRTRRFKRWQRTKKYSATSSSTFVEYFVLISTTRFVWLSVSFRASTKCTGSGWPQAAPARGGSSACGG